MLQISKNFFYWCALVARAAAARLHVTRPAARRIRMAGAALSPLGGRTGQAGWLTGAAAGVGQHLLVMAQDEVSCAMLWDSGVPCWVDNYCPRGEALPEGARWRCALCWRPCKGGGGLR